MEGEVEFGWQEMKKGRMDGWIKQIADNEITSQQYIGFR